MTSDELVQSWIGCDRCRFAKAVCLIRLINGELYFCGHHLNEYKETLDRSAYEIVELDKVERVPQLSLNERI